MSDRRQSKPHICLFSWMIPHHDEPMVISGPGSRGVPIPSVWATAKKIQTPQKTQTKNPLVFSGSVRSAADLFVEAGEQEDGSALD